MIVLHFITATNPPHTWIQPLPETLAGFLTTVWLLQNYRNFRVVFGYAKTPLELHSIAIPRRPTSLGPLIPLTIFLIGGFLCIFTGASTGISTFIVLGLSFAKASIRLMVEKLAKRSHYGRLVDFSTFCPLLLLMGWWFRHNIAYTLVFVLILDICWFVYSVMADLKRARGVCIFSITEGSKERKETGFYVAGGNLMSVQKAWREFAGDEKQMRAVYG